MTRVFFATLNSRQGFAPFELIEAVHRGELYTIIMDQPFEAQLESHRMLENLEHRDRFEQIVVSWLKENTGLSICPEEVVLDIPESISFEVDLPILRRDNSIAPYLETRTVFTPRVVNDFTQTLRYVRVAVSHRIGQRLSIALPFDDLVNQLAQ
jgi:hypothetical protein